MYLDYFSLKRHPFRITPDPSLFFAGGAHGRGVVLDALVYAITTGEGILKVVGEVGSGKTMLCRMLEERLPASVEIVYLANPNLSARDIIYAIAFELKLEVDANTDRLVVMHKLQDYLLQRHGDGASVVVFIEEAQSMPLETLEEVRLLSNLETHRHKLMQIVLFGQPELDRKLQDKSIRQLRERITHSFNLEPLTADEVREYLHFRLQTAGCPWPQLFSLKSEKMLAKASEGLTRRVNILADKALLASYADPATRQEPRSSSGAILPMVLPRHVKTAIVDSAYGSRFAEKYVPYSGYAVAAVTLAVLIFVLFKYVWVDADPLVASVPPENTVTGLSSSAAQTLAEPQAPAAEVSPNLIMPQSLTPVDEPIVDPIGEQRPVEIAAVNNSIATTTSSQDLRIEGEQSSPIVAALPVTENENIEEAVLQSASPEFQRQTEQPGDAGTNPSDAEPSSTINVINPLVETEVISQARQIDVAPAQSEIATVLSEADVQLAAEQKPSTAFVGLAAIRSEPSEAWLAGLSAKVGYTIQIFSVLTRQPEKLQQFLALLDTNMMLDKVYLCVISGNDLRSEQWLVLYHEFGGLSEALKTIEGFPANINQYAPYTRNLNDIECAN